MRGLLRHVASRTMLAVVLAVCAAGLGVVALAWARDNESPEAPLSAAPQAAADATVTPTRAGAPFSRDEDVPKPYFHQFLGFDGIYYASRWDDRALSDEAKRADPVYDPRWPPFSQCVAAGGLEVRADPSTKYNQDDLDRLLNRVNRENPDPAQNLQRPPDPLSAAGVFTRCALEWLTKSPEEIRKLTGVTEAGPK